MKSLKILLAILIVTIVSSVSGSNWLNLAADRDLLQYEIGESASFSLDVSFHPTNPTLERYLKITYDGIELDPSNFGRDLYLFRIGDLEEGIHLLKVQLYLRPRLASGNTTLIQQLVETIEVLPPEKAPIMIGDQAFTIDEDNPIEIALNGATDANGDYLTYRIIDQPSQGAITDCLDSSDDLICNYTPPENFFGEISFSYIANDGGMDAGAVSTVTITVNPINDLPIMPADISVVGNQDEPFSITLAEATDVENEDIIYTLESAPTNGILTNCLENDSDLICDYTPNSEFSGDDSFSYLAHDPHGQSEIATTVNIQIDSSAGPIVILGSSIIEGFSSLEITFNTMGSFSPDSIIDYYLYDFGDGSDVEKVYHQSVEHLFRHLGTHYVNVTAKDILGRTSSTTMEIYVAGSGRPLPKIDFSGNVGNAPISILLDGSTSYSNSAIKSYQWAIDGAVVSSQPTFLHNFTTEGIYTIALTVADSENDVGTRETTIEVLPADGNDSPIANFIMDAIRGESPMTVNFDASGSTDDGEIVRYSWEFGDGSSIYEITSTEPTIEHIFKSTESTTFTVRLKVEDNLGKNGYYSDIVNITAPVNPLPHVAFSALPNQGEVPHKVAFNAENSKADGESTISAYSWDFGDGNSSTGELIEHSYTQRGIYTATLTVTDSLGASDNLQTTIYVGCSQETGDNICAYLENPEEDKLLRDSSLQFVFKTLEEINWESVKTTITSQKDNIEIDLTSITNISGTELQIDKEGLYNLITDYTALYDLKIIGKAVDQQSYSGIVTDLNFATGSITGTIDNPAATIRMVSANKKIDRILIIGAGGEFDLSDLPFGNYKLYGKYNNSLASLASIVVTPFTQSIIDMYLIDLFTQKAEDSYKVTNIVSKIIPENLRTIYADASSLKPSCLSSTKSTAAQNAMEQIRGNHPNSNYSDLLFNWSPSTMGTSGQSSVIDVPVGETEVTIALKAFALENESDDTFEGVIVYYDEAGQLQIQEILGETKEELGAFDPNASIPLASSSFLKKTVSVSSDITKRKVFVIFRNANMGREAKLTEESICDNAGKFSVKWGAGSNLELTRGSMKISKFLPVDDLHGLDLLVPSERCRLYDLNIDLDVSGKVDSDGNPDIKKITSVKIDVTGGLFSSYVNGTLSEDKKKIRVTIPPKVFTSFSSFTSKLDNFNIIFTIEGEDNAGNTIASATEPSPKFFALYNLKNLNLTTYGVQCMYGRKNTYNLVSRMNSDSMLRIWFNDVSLPYGGSFKPHLKHKTGEDIDLYLMGLMSYDEIVRKVNKALDGDAGSKIILRDYVLKFRTMIKRIKDQYPAGNDGVRWLTISNGITRPIEHIEAALYSWWEILVMFGRLPDGKRLDDNIGDCGTNCSIMNWVNDNDHYTHIHASM